MELPFDVDQKQMKKGWKSFISGINPINDIRPEIINAWERCKKLGVNPYIKEPKRITDSKEIEQRIKANEKLLLVSKPAINHLYNFIAGSKSFVSVSDVDGYLLLVYADEETVEPQGGILYTNWNEKNMGNNPIGTSIIENRALFVSGYEHYCIYPHYYAGAGAPIHDPDGKIIGSISITKKSDSIHYHTLGMIVMTAYAIERHLKILDSLHSLDIAYNQINNIINSISQGLVVINDEHNITFVNNIFNKYFSLDDNLMINKNVLSILTDPLIKEVLNQRTSLTDYVTEISINNITVPCTLTYNPIKTKNSNEGIIIINELSRVKKLARKINNSNASFTFKKIVGLDESFLDQIDMAKSLSLTDSNILLLGESGTGKDVIAQAIHNYSNRKNGPFVPINCGAIPKDLINSELFGYKEGAFTGASKGGSVGKFELANSGTIFLDEIAEMPLDIQVTLLRVIETRIINPVGSTSYIPINVRIIAATNKNLLTAIKLNNFREDLYYRLNVLSLTLIPLRQRKKDIKNLVVAFLAELNLKYGKNIDSITDRVWKILLDYDWPGNIRELKNVIERCVALSKDNSITLALLPTEIMSSNTTYHTNQLDLAPITIVEDNTDEAIILKKLLDNHRWNITLVAKKLEVSRTTIYRKISKYGLDKS